MKLEIHKSKIRMGLLIVVCILFASYGASNGNNAFGILAVVISMLLLLTGTPEENFDILVAMIPFQYCWAIGGTSLRGIMCIIPMLVLIKKRKMHLDIVVSISITILLLLEIINDFSHVELFSFINTIAPILYLGLLVITEKDELINWSINRMAFVFIVSATIACTAVLIIGGGLSAYNNDISWYRFGQESTISLLPGSMEIPVFNSITMYVIMVYFLYGKLDTIIKKILSCMIFSVHILFGLLTVSRVFMIGVLLMAVLFLAWMVRYSKVKGIKLIVIGAVVIFVIYIMQKDLVLLLLDKLFGRFSSGSGGDNGRSFIWIECINYLLTHIKALLMGEGITYYPILGTEKGYAFSYMAHNFYLDVLMGIGIIGTVCLGILFEKLVTHGRKNILAYGILIILAGVFLVSGTLNYIRNYIYIIMGIIFMNNFKTQIEDKI
ncbi:O-antigen ligase family protein [Eubacterium sp. MSJ-33]|uniref:O-antigen ligase family protein n=1 Tax=Eubacterium sp. MSJ-33 TaxID=2841528 RepID=UPI001C73FAE4|nr:O-antigen ligase family protein [Eubacterium sp. MSJ-33]QWT54147.1 O-antigen ligase family protein [Eubacterium sp. MSJ-33]